MRDSLIGHKTKIHGILIVGLRENPYGPLLPVIHSSPLSPTGCLDIAASTYFIHVFYLLT